MRSQCSRWQHGLLESDFLETLPQNLGLRACACWRPRARSTADCSGASDGRQPASPMACPSWKLHLNRNLNGCENRYRIDALKICFGFVPRSVVRGTYLRRPPPTLECRFAVPLFDRKYPQATTKVIWNSGFQPKITSRCPGRALSTKLRRSNSITNTG